MTFRNGLLFSLSAILFGVPVLWSPITWPVVFLFPIPLFYLVTFSNLSYMHGFIWGLLAFSVHTSGVFWGIDNLAQGSIAARFTPLIIIVSYLSLYSLAWFCINTVCIKFFKLSTIPAKLVLWIITYWLFILFMENYCLSIFGRAEGYFLFNPVFVLAEKPQLLSLVSYLGKTLLLLCILCLAGSIVFAYITKSLHSFLLVFLFTLPWLTSLFIQRPQQEPPPWIYKVAHLPAVIPEMINLQKQALIAQNLFKLVAEQSPNAELIVMPESSMQCNHLSTTPSMCAVWSEKELGRPLHIILGSFRWDGPAYRNTLHWCYNGTLQNIFDKRHAMLLTEQIPATFKLNILEDLFFTTSAQVSPSTAPRPIFTIFEGVSFVPYICSELFFNDQPDDTYPPGSTIIASTNDYWSKKTNISHLMQLTARFRAIQWQRNILYISFLYAKYFDQYGNEFDLKNIATTAKP